MTHPPPTRRTRSYEFSRPEEGGTWTPEPVKAERFLSVLSRFQPALNWDEEAAEHYVKFKVGGC